MVLVLELDEVQLAVDPRALRCRHWPGEEVWLGMILVIDEDAAHRVGEEMPEQ